jgi:RimJ/RimL family protein N-acetyltransferase
MSDVWEGASTRLAGRLVTLEPLAREHTEALYAASRDPDMWQWLPIRQPATPEEFARWMDDALTRAAEGADVPFATVDAGNGTVIGSTRFLNLRPHDRVLEIGWTWVSPTAWNAGANAEAKLLQMRHAFERMGARRVEFKTDALNARARRALEALPAQFEGIHRKHMLVRRGENRDSAWYSVVDDEWPDVRTNLERRLEAHR